MKKIFAMTTLSLLTATAAFAAPGDQYDLVLDCKSEVVSPDNGLKLQVLTGGIAGGTTIRTVRSMIYGQQIDNYFVKRLPMDSEIAGAPVQYKGKGILFSINFTVAPRPDGKHVGVLQTKQHGTETVLCELNN